jgi:hypothetical protein
VLFDEESEVNAKITDLHDKIIAAPAETVKDVSLKLAVICDEAPVSEPDEFWFLSLRPTVAELHRLVSP